MHFEIIKNVHLYIDIYTRFGLLEGVVHTRVGYAGGTKENPTYRSLGDHTETLQVD